MRSMKTKVVTEVLKTHLDIAAGRVTLSCRRLRARFPMGYFT